MQDYAYVRFQSCSDNIIVSSNSTPARLNARKQMKQSLVIVISVCLDIVFKTLKNVFVLSLFIFKDKTDAVFLEIICLFDKKTRHVRHMLHCLCLVQALTV